MASPEPMDTSPNPAITSRRSRRNRVTGTCSAGRSSLARLPRSATPCRLVASNVLMQKLRRRPTIAAESRVLADCSTMSIFERNCSLLTQVRIRRAKPIAARLSLTVVAYEATTARDCCCAVGTVPGSAELRYPLAAKTGAPPGSVYRSKYSCSRVMTVRGISTVSPSRCRASRAAGLVSCRSSLSAVNRVAGARMQSSCSASLSESRPCRPPQVQRPSRSDALTVARQMASNSWLGRSRMRASALGGVGPQAKAAVRASQAAQVGAESDEQRTVGRGGQRGRLARQRETLRLDRVVELSALGEPPDVQAVGLGGRDRVASRCAVVDRGDWAAVPWVG